MSDTHVAMKTDHGHKFSNRDLMEDLHLSSPAVNDRLDSKLEDLLPNSHIGYREASKATKSLLASNPCTPTSFPSKVNFVEQVNTNADIVASKRS